MMNAPRLDIHSDAVAEASEAYAWYAQRSPTAAARFIVEIDQAMQRILADPERWPIDRGATRRYLLRKFPYKIVYRPMLRGVEVLAIAHAKRKPGYWADRLS